MIGFKVTDITYHRNGICGRPFYSVRFAYNSGDGIEPNMLAIMPENANLKDNTECFVIDMNHPTEKWRGDDFARDVRAAVKEHQNDLRKSLGLHRTPVGG